MQSDDVDIREFAHGYLREMRDTSQDSMEFWSQLHEWIDREPERAWRALVELSRIASTDEAGRLGAGPLEELLVTHDVFAERAAELAGMSEMFKSMLSCVTPSGMSSEAERIIRIAIE